MTSGIECADSLSGALSAAEVEALLFSAAMSFDDAEERDRFLGFACRDKPDLLARLHRLTSEYSAADEFFEFDTQVNHQESIATATEESTGLDLEVGRYRLIERVGSGSCGVVYLAEQEQPVRRKVALKIIRIGLETPEAIARFELERQALASMNHPNIARVLDAGTHASGRPFFVMEFVEGENIGHYCDARKLNIRERMQLFVQVCQAIQHAHQKGVIHRDIKPSNVLVETHELTPVPKIIDFGIAQEDGKTSIDVHVGKTGEFAGSPVYMSPEQVCGVDAVDTRSDIYSLGMLLAELLAGPHHHLPIDLMERSQEEIRKILTSCRPMLPSESLAELPAQQLKEIALNRKIHPSALLKLCHKELDWLVAKAIQPDPSLRYDTPTVLAADVLRWLHGKALRAHPPTRRYRLTKLIGRNRLVFGSIALAFIGLLGGFSVATVLFLREKEARAAETRLRSQAETAHQAEILARKRWEFRSRVAESAVRLRYGDPEGAEKLLASIPIEETPPSLESTSVYNSLAEWHRTNGRFEEAEIRFLGMIHALAGIDRAQTGPNSDLFLPAAALLSRSSKPERYAELRRIALDLYGDTQDRLVAERILKTCLLRPTPAADLKQTAKLVTTLEKIAQQQSGNPLWGWESFSVALHYYRVGDDEQTETWTARCMEWPRSSRLSVLLSRALRGLVLQRRGDQARAMELLTSVVADSTKYLQVPPTNPDEGLWYDVANLRTLLEEAGWSEGTLLRER